MRLLKGLYHSVFVYFLFICLPFFALANEQLGSCYPGELEIPTTLIEREFSKIDCSEELLNTTYLYGEKHFGEPVSRALKSMTQRSSELKNVFGFFEGEFIGENHKGYRFGIEGDFRSLTDLQLMLIGIANLNTKNKNSSEPVSFESFLIDGLLAMKRVEFVWAQVKDKFLAYNLNNDLISSLNDWLDGNSTYKNHQHIDALGLFRAERDLFINHLDDLQRIVLEFLHAYSSFLKRDPFFADFSEKRMITYALGLRELEWLKEIKAKVCEANQINKDIWIQIGRGHKDRMSCAFKSLGIKVITPTSFEMERRFFRWMESVDLDSFSDFKSFLNSRLQGGDRKLEIAIKEKGFFIEVNVTGPIFWREFDKLEPGLVKYFQEQGLILVEVENHEGSAYYTVGPRDIMSYELTVGDKFWNLFE